MSPGLDAHDKLGPLQLVHPLEEWVIIHRQPQQFRWGPSLAIFITELGLDNYISDIQGSHRAWKPWKMKMLIWKVTEREKLAKSRGIYQIYQICAFSVDIKKFSISLKHPHFLTFLGKISEMQYLSREIFMQNRETVIEKSREKRICKIYGNPDIVFHRKFIFPYFLNIFFYAINWISYRDVYGYHLDT